MSLWFPFTQMQGHAPRGRVVEARGPWLTLDDGRRVFDGISSWWVSAHGHCHPRVVEAIRAQAAAFDQVILADFTHGPIQALAEALPRVLPGRLDHVFFSDDGSTAVEVALKMAWQGQRARDPSRWRFAALEGGYHGDTLGAMRVGARDVFTAPFDALLGEVDLLPLDLDAAAAWFQRHGHELVCLILEPLVQGAGGMRFYPPELLAGLARLCREAGALLIADEVMTGFGRLGAMTACARAGVEPDLVCLSKALTGGALPMGATACGEALYARFLHEEKARGFLHGHSFTGNPISAAAALASLAVFEEEQTLARVAGIEAAFRARAPRFEALPGVRDVRAMGALFAFNLGYGPGGYLDPAAREVTQRAWAEGLFIRPLGDVVYLMPPLNTPPEALAWALDVLHHALDAA